MRRVRRNDGEVCATWLTQDLRRRTGYKPGRRTSGCAII